MLELGAQIDRYEVEIVLGRGGFATVYRVRHRALGTLHALKVLHTSSAAMHARIMEEGRVQASLAHPNIVAVTDVFDVEGAPALLMEYVAGPTLKDLLRAGRLQSGEAAGLFREIVSAVACAHAAGIAHRDLKPANVLIAEDALGIRQPKVSDFGLAKLLAEDGPGLTRSGMAMGTPDYMAPEQMRDASRVDHRADIFSLGVMLYELLSGSRPFAGDTRIDVMNATLRGVYDPIDSRVPGVPAHIRQAVERCLVVDRDKRLTRIEELSALLDGRVAAPEAAPPPWEPDNTFASFDSFDAMASGGEGPAAEPEAAEPEAAEPEAAQAEAAQPQAAQPQAAQPAVAKPEPSAPEPSSGPERFGEFELLEELGRGGMGIVYKARQPSLDRVVALKVLPRELVEEPVARERFLREVRALSQSSHPNLVQVRSHGDVDGVPWFSMEFVEGADLGKAWDVLSDWMSTGLPLFEGHLQAAVSQSSAGGRRSRRNESRVPLAAAEVPALPAGQRDLLIRLCELFADAADGLHHLHEHGIVHRDVKPGNLMLSADGKRLVVMDLGLASVSAASKALTSADITVLGTLRYMPPEQLQRQFLEVDRRADVYALGASLVELATGTPFFDGDTEQRLIQQVLNEDPLSARQREPSVPVDLDTVLRKATAKRAAERYPTAEAFAADLRAFGRGEAVSVRPPSPARKARLWMRNNPVPSAMLGVAVVLVGGFALFLAAAGLALPRLSGNRDKLYARVDARWGGLTGEGWRPDVWWIPSSDEPGETGLRAHMKRHRPERIERLRWDGQPIDRGGPAAVVEQSFADGLASSVVLKDADGAVLQRISVDCEQQPEGGARCVRRFQDALGGNRPDPDLGVVAQLQLLDPTGRVAEHRGLALDGLTPAAYADGSWGRRFQRDERGRLLVEEQLDAEGTPAEDRWGCARTEVILASSSLPARLVGATSRRSEHGADASGRPAPCLDGAVGIQHGRSDDDPFPTGLGRGGGAKRRSWLGEDGALAWNRWGYAVRLRQRDRSPADAEALDGAQGESGAAIDLPADGGRADRLAVTERVLTAYLDTAEAPVAAQGGGPLLRESFHGELLLEEEQLDLLGELLLGADGWARRTTAWLDGRPVMVQTFRPGGVHVRAVEGAAARIVRYEEARPTRISWLDEQLHPTRNRWGVGTEERRWEQGRLVQLRHLDEEGALALHLERGFAEASLAWDERGRLHSVRTTGGDGRPIAPTGDWSAWTMEYDEAGFPAARAGQGTDGAPLERCDGVQREALVRGADGRIDAVRFTTPQGVPAADHTGIAELRFRRDALGRPTRIEHLGLDGAPVADAEGCAARRLVRGPGDTLAEETCLGSDGEPQAGAAGHATVRRVHDAQGRLLVESFEDAEGRPVAGPRGYARHELERDGRGRVRAESWQDSQGGPVAGPDGYSHREPATDAVGRLALERVRRPRGATVGLAVDRDSQGRVVARRVVDETGGAVLHPDGWHRKVIGRDAWGNASSEAWFDLDGEAATGPAGVARLARDLRPDGEVLAVRCFDPRGRPLACPPALRPAATPACRVEPGRMPGLFVDPEALP